jgi:hypothetical protein
MATRWQITINEDAPVELTDLNLRLLGLRRVNQGESVLRMVQAVQDGQTATPLSRHAQVLIERAVGSGAFSTWFLGWISKVTSGFSGTQHAFEYEVADAWHWFEKCPYLQTWYTLVDPTHPENSVVGGYRTQLLLGRGVNGVRITVSDIIEDIITQVNLMAVTSGDPGASAVVQSSGSYPAVNLPTRQMGNTTHGGVIRELMKWLPDHVVWMDYSTNPTTLRVTPAASAASRVLDFNLDVAGEVRLERRSDLEFNRVAIVYGRSDTYNGAVIGFSYADVYPAPGGFNAYTPSTYGAFLFDFNCLVTYIDLQGYGRSTVYSTLATREWAPDDLTWWKNQFQALKNVTTAVITPKRLIYEDGSEYNYEDHTGTAPAFANELLNTGGAIYAGFFLAGTNTPVQKARYRLECTAAYVTDSAEYTAQPIFCEFTATNATSGTYSRTEVYELGEDPVAGLAQQLYTAVSRARWEGVIPVTVQNLGEGSYVGADVNLGDFVQIRNGRSEWATDMQVQAIEDDPHNGTRKIHVGPVAFLSAKDRIELIRGLRDYVTFGGNSIAPGLMATGVPAGNRVTTPDRIPSQSGSQLHDGVKSLAVERADTKTAGSVDGDGVLQIIARQDVPADGIKEGAEVTIDLADCNDSGGDPHALTVRELDYCQDGVAKKIMVLASEPYDAP